MSLARAVYNDADLYLLDDPLSAVDAHVGAHIFEHVIADSGMLGGKTRVLVTNDVKHLKRVDDIVVLREGRIAERGNYEQLLSNDGAFAEFLRNYDETKKSKSGKDAIADKPVEDIKQERKKKRRGQISLARQISESHAASVVGARSSYTRSISMSPTSALGSSFDAAMLSGHQFAHMLDEEERRSEIAEQDDGGIQEEEEDNECMRDDDGETLITGATSNNNNNNNSGALVEDEAAEVGRVSWKVYLHYLTKLGRWVALSVMVMHIMSQLVLSGSNLWLAKWADSHDNKTANTTSNLGDAEYLGLYGGMCAVFIFLEIARDLALFLCAASASEVIHR